jgi:hypothetical protein
MPLTIFQRRLNIKDYYLVVRDFLDESKKPVATEIIVFDRQDVELEHLHTAAHPQDRLETIKKTKKEIHSHLKALKTQVSKAPRTRKKTA